MFRKLFRMLHQPDEFFESVRGEGFWQPFVFFLQVSLIIALFTPIANYLG